MQREISTPKDHSTLSNACFKKPFDIIHLFTSFQVIVLGLEAWSPLQGRNVEEGDIIENIDGDHASKIPFDTIPRLLQGAEGEQITLTFKKKEKQQNNGFAEFFFATSFPALSITVARVAAPVVSLDFFPVFQSVVIGLLLLHCSDCVGRLRLS